jgi:hypothetical protein
VLASLSAQEASARGGHLPWPPVQWAMPDQQP